MVIWAVGFLFESIGDAQLSAFRRDPANAGKVMQAGLWRYTRHPNYFGDAVQWWGQYILAFAAGGWWTIGAPVVMTYLLLRVSGVAMLERTIGNRRPEYAEYVRRTSAFLPRPPRS
jgi:steroid 5-alpha reductase family enzyme